MIGELLPCRSTIKQLLPCWLIWCVGGSVCVYMHSSTLPRECPSLHIHQPWRLRACVHAPTRALPQPHCSREHPIPADHRFPWLYWRLSCSFFIISPFSNIVKVICLHFAAIPSMDVLLGWDLFLHAMVRVKNTLTLPSEYLGLLKTIAANGLRVETGRWLRDMVTW